MKFRSLHDNPILQCKICGKDFAQERWNQVCCSKDCMKVNYKQNQKAAYKKWRIRNRESNLKYMRDYNNAHRERHSEQCKAYNQKVKENAKNA